MDGSAASTRDSPFCSLPAKLGMPVCPHAGGVGLCEYEQHISMFDHIGQTLSCARVVLHRSVLRESEL